MSIYAVNGKEPIAAWIESRDTEAVTSAVASDLISGTYPGTLTNMDLTADPDTARIADTGAGGTRALELDGVNDFVSLGTSAALSISGEMAISCWYKSAGSYTQDQAIIGNCDSGGGLSNYILTVGYTGQKVEWWNNAATPVAASSNNIADTNWHHLAAVRSGSAGSWTIKIYVDGSLVANTTTSQNPHGSTRPTSIGRFGAFGGYYTKGRIDDVRVWNQVIDATDVSYLYNSGAGRGRVAVTAETRRRRQSVSGGVL